MLPFTTLFGSVSTWITTNLLAPYVAGLLASYMTPPPTTPSDWLSGIGKQMFPNLFPRQAPPANFLSGLFGGHGHRLGSGNFLFSKLFIHEALPEDPYSRQSIMSWLLTTFMGWAMRTLAPFLLLLSLVCLVGYYIYKRKVSKRGQQDEKKSRIEVNVTVNVQVQSAPARNWSPTVNVQTTVIAH